MVNYRQNQYLTYGEMNLINDFRSEWSDLAIFMRSYVLSELTGIQGLSEAVSKRLYRIPEDFKTKLQPFLGITYAEQFQHLLLMFIVYSQELITATQKNDPEAVNNSITALYKSIDDIAIFLSGCNPYWSKEQWQDLFYKLIEMGLAELKALQAGDYERDLELLENLIDHTLIMGDYMANGLIRYLSP